MPNTVVFSHLSLVFSKLIINQILEPQFKLIKLSPLFYALSYSENLTNTAVSFQYEPEALQFEDAMKETQTSHDEKTHKLQRTLSRIRRPSITVVQPTILNIKLIAATGLFHPDFDELGNKPSHLAPKSC